MGMSHQPMMNQPMMNQPMNQPMMNQPMNQPMMNQPMNQPMMNQPMNHPMANPHHPMPFMHGMEGDDSENHPFMMGEGQKQGGCGCSGKKSMPMGYENQPPNQMMDPNMNNWFPMMNDNEQMRGYFPQPGQPPQPLYNWEAEQPWQDDEDED
ncbi:hypothetical protein [Halobacillus andaensis]|uniref:hypothetical protein n=1 Tax=Halobacillus andaensis TaxID=1176239 RepID=UPI003D73E9FC